MRSFHVPNVTAKTLKPIIVANVNKASYLMTDESPVYSAIGREFGGHGTVNHSAEEYVRADFWHTNTAENYFRSLSAASMVATSTSARPICIATRPSSISAIITGALGIDDLARADRAPGSRASD